MTERDYDVIVMGAGPAGAEAAFCLARRGWRVLVLEKEALDREKSCGGGIQTQELIEFGDLPADVVDREIDSARIFSAGGDCLELPRYGNRSAATVRRAVFDTYLQERARTAGATLLAHHEVVDCKPGAHGVTVSARSNGSVHGFAGRLMICASGAGATPVKNRLGIPKPNPRRTYVAMQRWIRLGEEVIDERIGGAIELFTGQDLIPNGYAWIFPKRDIVSVGIGATRQTLAEQRIRLTRVFESFLRSHPVVSDQLAHGEVVRQDGGLIPAEPLERLVYPGVLFVGDAGGFGNILHGGGIYQARKSSRFAADHVDQFLETADARHLHDYEGEIKTLFWEYENKWDNKMLPFFWKDRLLNSTVSLAAEGREDIGRAFSIILNSTESHRHAYEIFERTMLDILHRYLRAKAEPYRALLEQQLRSVELHDGLLRDTAEHLLLADAKRFRATLAFLAYRLFEEDHERVAPVAAAYELLHTASLMHDDIMDSAPVRRGRPTAHRSFGIGAAITAGDALIFEAYRLLGSAGFDDDLTARLVRMFSRSGARVARGQGLDLELTKAFDRWSVPRYLEMIRLKTGALIQAPLEAGALVAGATAEEVAVLAQVGESLGMAFQMIDDSNDLLASSDTILKSLYADIREGKCTIILARCHGLASDSQRRFIESTLASADAGPDDFEAVVALCREHDAIGYSQRRCSELANRCEADLRRLPDSPSRGDLLEINELIHDWCDLGE